jgi:hypothetical protein
MTRSLMAPDHRVCHAGGRRRGRGGERGLRNNGTLIGGDGLRVSRAGASRRSDVPGADPVTG